MVASPLVVMVSALRFFTPVMLPFCMVAVPSEMLLPWIAPPAVRSPVMVALPAVRALWIEALAPVMAPPA